jgi:hypothetical protein
MEYQMDWQDWINEYRVDNSLECWEDNTIQYKINRKKTTMNMVADRKFMNISKPSQKDLKGYYDGFEESMMDVFDNS